MKKCVLVTGSRGLIGTRFFEQFGEVCDLISGDLDDGFDLLDPSTFSTVIAERSVDAIVHLAAFTDVSAAHAQQGDESGLCYQLNVTGTANVVNLARQLQAHLIHVSTDFVFDGKQNRAISEDDLPAPIEWYGETKLLAEQLVVDNAEAWTIIRIAFPFLREEGVRPDLVANIACKLRAGEPLYLFGDQIITPTLADDVAAALFRMIERRPENEIFHVMGPESMSPCELGHCVAGCLNLSPKNIVETSLIDYLKKDPRPRQQYTSMNTQKYRSFCKEHGYSLPVSVSEALG